MTRRARFAKVDKVRAGSQAFSPPPQA